MDLACLDLGCIENQINQVSFESDISPNDSLLSNSKPPRSKVSKQGNQSSPRVLNRLTAQIKKPTKRKTSPLGWFPRKKGDSYLKRKLKLLQEVDGMCSTLDETLGDTNPHFSKVLREKIAVREAANKAIEARKAALVEASWCRILRASRIDSKEAEDVLLKAEESANEAFESAKEIGVIMYDIQDCPRKHYKIETSSGKGGKSTTHKVTTSFDTAFEVDKQVAAAVKAAFVKLSTCASIGQQEFKEILKKISQNPDLDENCQETCELTSECESDAGVEFESKFHKNEMESSKENLVDMMLKRLRCLREEELASLATIVATCGLNAALAESENSLRVTDKSVKHVSSKEPLPGLDKFLVRRLSRLEKEIQDAKTARTKDTLHKDKVTKPSEVITVPDLGSMLTKHTSKLEKEIEEIKKKCGNEYEPAPKGKPSERLKPDMNNNDGNIPSLGEVLVKRVSRLEKEVQEAKKEKENVNINRDKRSKEKVTNDDNNNNNVESLDKVLVKHVSRLEKDKMAFGDMKEEVKVNGREKKMDMEHGEGGLDQILVKHKSRLEKEKVVVDEVEPDNEVKNPLVAKREARERELQEAWGGMSFGNSIRPRVSRLQREKAAWIKAEEAERRANEEPSAV